MTNRDFGQPDDQSPIEAQLAAPPASGGGHDTDSQARHQSATHQSKLIQSRGAVLAALFLVTGVLGIPLLWMNRNFSNVERIVWTVIVTIYTIILVGIVVAIVIWSYRQIFP